MPDPIRIAAVARRDALLSEAARLNDFLKTYDELAAIQIGEAQFVAPIMGAPARPPEPFRVLAATSGPALRVSTATADDERADYNQRLRGWKAAQTEKMASEIIRQSGPRQTAFLHAELAKRGHEVGGKSPTETLFSRLSRAQSLEYDKLEGWRFKRESRQTNEAAGLTFTEEPAASGHDSDLPGELTHRAAVNPVGGGGI